MVGHELGGDIGINDIWGPIVVGADTMFASHKNVTCIVDRTAEHFVYVGIIERIFPKARVTH